MPGRRARALPRSCEEARLLASLELDGELDEIGSVHLRRHLEGCPDCPSWVAEMTAVTSLLREARFEPVPVDMTPGTPSTGDRPCSWSMSGTAGDRSFRLLSRGRH